MAPVDGSGVTANPLPALARMLGVATDYRDAEGQHHTVSETSLRAIIGALGYAAQDDNEAAASLKAAAEKRDHSGPPSVLVVRADEFPIRIPLGGVLPDSEIRWRLQLEEGTIIEGSASIENHAFSFDWAGPAPLGYHYLEIETRDDGSAKGFPLIVVPHSAYRPAMFEDDGQCWGIATQLYGLRSDRNWGIGDFTDLAELIRGTARLGGAIVGVNPLHALFPAWPLHISPYSPSTRLFRNPLYIDIESVPEFSETESLRNLVADAAFQEQLVKLRAEDLVDYQSVAAIKNQAFELLYRTFRDRLADSGNERGKAFHAFQIERNPALRRFALFMTLAERMGERNAPTLHDWPADHRDPHSSALTQFEVEHLERVEYHEYLQWVAEAQLAQAGEIARRLNMGIGLYQDLAVGVDSVGAEVWMEPGLFASGISVGAPPDPWNLKGQDWGLPPWNPIALREAAYRPFIELLRANMRHAGALRIDHVMGLMRLYWIPRGAGAQQGSYVDYPWDDLIGLVALESQRHQCLIIGEDLGTLPEGMREKLEAAGILSIRLLYFERDRTGRMNPPERYPRGAAVSIGTHDLPPLSAFWDGSDLTIRDRLNLWPSEERRAADLAERPEHRSALLQAFRDQAVLEPLESESAIPVKAAHAFLSRTPSRIVTLHIEDIIGETRSANVPGTFDDHPNWRRKLGVPVEKLWSDRRVLEVIDRLAARSFASLPSNEKPSAVVQPLSVVPRATYRLQMGSATNFDQVAGLVPYLDALGISHLYASSWFKARTGSTHGYDVTDHNAINPEIGDERALDNLTNTMSVRGLGHIVDFVPNHMGIGRATNEWWQDILEWGEHSEFAEYFDIDWMPLKNRLRHKVMVPILGEHYGTALEAGQLVPRFDAAAGRFSIHYFDHVLPIAPQHYPALIRAGLVGVDESAAWRGALIDLSNGFAALGRRNLRWSARIEQAKTLRGQLAALAQAEPGAAKSLTQGAASSAGTPGNPDSFRPLNRLIEQQAYILTYWRVASDEINYRHFFDVTELAGLRVENPDVFMVVHRLVAKLIRQGAIQGLRIDHIDGLFHPREYCTRLQQLAQEAGGGEEPFFIVVEKILARHESLRQEWPIAGTTGYDFMSQVNGLLIDVDGEAKLTRAYQRFIGREVEFDEMLYECKKLIMETLLGSELTMLSSVFGRIAESHWRTRDYTLDSLRKGLVEIVACFPVYRSYVARRGALADDRRDIVWAVRQARKKWRTADGEILDFIESVLTTDLVRPSSSGYRRDEVIGAAMRFQQYTGPVMAKAFEDTTFYRYLRLVSLNEVGGDPRQFGLSTAAFHARNTERARRWPHTMLATSTHDTKRGEDVRARINVLSEIPGAWEQAARRWATYNRRKKTDANGRLAPSRNDEYLLYQTLVGAWPLDLDIEAPAPAGLADFIERIGAYMVKAMREAKLATSWLSPDTAYEDAVRQFVARVLDPVLARPFLADFSAFHRRVATLGMFNGLAQTALKLTCPGVPDFYQGSELWDLNLVDPDNRRIPDFALRRRLLSQIVANDEHDPAARASNVEGMLRDWKDGRIKLHVVRALLALRRAREPVFTDGSYRPLASAGLRADRVFSFVREVRGDFVLVAVGRNLAPLLSADETGLMPEAWDDTRIEGLHHAATGLQDALTGRIVPVKRGVLKASDLFATLPVAVLMLPRV